MAVFSDRGSRQHGRGVPKTLEKHILFRGNLHGGTLLEIIDENMFFWFAGRVQEEPFQKFAKKPVVVSGRFGFFIFCVFSNHDHFYGGAWGRFGLCFASAFQIIFRPPSCGTGRAQKEYVAGCGVDNFSVCTCVSGLSSSVPTPFQTASNVFLCCCV